MEFWEGDSGTNTERKYVKRHGGARTNSLISLLGGRGFRQVIESISLVDVSSWRGLVFSTQEWLLVLGPNCRTRRAVWVNKGLKGKRSTSTTLNYRGFYKGTYVLRSRRLRPVKVTTIFFVSILHYFVFSVPWYFVWGLSSVRLSL